MTQDRRPLVLLAEDEPEQNAALSESLSDAGYRVITAFHSLQVMVSLLDRPDVVVLDLGGVATPDVFRALASMPRRPALLLYSADRRIAELAQEFNADGYVAKPCSVQAVVRKLDELLTRERRREEVREPRESAR